MNRARSSDSKTHAEKSNQTSRTHFSSKTLRDIFFGSPCRLISKSNYQCRKLVVVRFSNSSSVDSVGEPDFPMILNRSSSVQCVPSVTSAERTTSSSDSTFSTPAVNKFDPVFTKSSSQEYRSARSFLSHPIGTTSKICIKEIWFLNNMTKKTVLSELNVHGLLLFQCNTWLEEWGQS